MTERALFQFLSGLARESFRMSDVAQAVTRDAPMLKSAAVNLAIHTGCPLPPLLAAYRRILGKKTGIAKGFAVSEFLTVVLADPDVRGWLQRWARPDGGRISA